jgi:uncharacterized protein
MFEWEKVRSFYPENDPVHGFDHVLRVVQLAEMLAQAEGANLEIVRAAALLHDSRIQVSDDSSDAERRLEHHEVSAELAASFLKGLGWSQNRILAVQHCIRAHRFRDEQTPPLTIEAIVLFDADKLDAIGAVGVARAIAYAVQAGKPFYAHPSMSFLKGGVLEPAEKHSAYHEYVFKLAKIKERLLTESGRSLAEARHQRMQNFFEGLADELIDMHSSIGL